jgi:hypothetical protein
MFPAYSTDKNAPSTSKSSSSSHITDQTNDLAVVSFKSGQENITTQTFNSLKSLKLVKETTVDIIELDKSDDGDVSQDSSSSSTDASSHKRHKNKRSKKEKKKKKKKKKKKTKRDQSPETKKIKYETTHLKLIDHDYQTYFARFTKDQLKSFLFQEDFLAHGGIHARNAFKLDTRGDRNNLCFDQVYYKQLCKYSIPFFFDQKPEDILSKQVKTTTGKKMTRKQLRRKILTDARQKRYFAQKCPDDTLSSSSKPPPPPPAADTLSNKMWLYLEMKKYFEKEMTQAPPPPSIDYIKYLHENAHDIDKWLAFISSQQQHGGADSYERVLSIYERGIQENPTSFRLKLEYIKYKSHCIELNTVEFDAGAKIERDYVELMFVEAAFLSKNKTNLVSYKNLFETWFEYLKFLQESNLSQHTFERTKRAYTKCFEFFLTQSHKNIMKESFFADNYLNLLESYCTFLRLNGYYEKSLAVYQAVIDFNFCSQTQSVNSKYNNLDFKSRKALYELYMDMGLPKFGEKFSMGGGWLNSLENRQSQFDKLDDAVEETSTSTSTRYEEKLDHIEDSLLVKDGLRVEFKWSEIERLRACFFWYPFYPRTFSGESADDCCDPDRLVSFDDDLKFCLFDLPSEDEDYYKFKLFCKLLKFFNIIKWNDATELASLNGDKEFASCLNMNDSTSNGDFLSDLFKNLSKNTKWFYDEEEKLYLEHMFKSVTQNVIEFLRNCLRTVESGGFKSLEFQTNLIILKWKFELKILDLIRKYPLSFQIGNIF